MRSAGRMPDPKLEPLVLSEGERRTLRAAGWAKVGWPGGIPPAHLRPQTARLGQVLTSRGLDGIRTVTLSDISISGRSNPLPCTAFAAIEDHAGPTAG